MGHSQAPTPHRDPGSEVSVSLLLVAIHPVPPPLSGSMGSFFTLHEGLLSHAATSVSKQQPASRSQLFWVALAHRRTYASNLDSHKQDFAPTTHHSS